MARKSTARAEEEKAAEESTVEEKTVEEESVEEKAEEKQEGSAEAVAPSSAERSLAAVSHAAIAFLYPLAVIVSGAMWVAHRGRSEFVASNSFQAFIAHAILDVSTFVLGAVAILLRGLPLVGWLFFYLLVIVVCLSWVAAVAWGIYGAVRARNGEEFNYPVVSDLVRS